jgi:DNA-binding XRE family transcriptional regulator
MAEFSSDLFVQQLKSLRKQRGWTQQEVADQLGLKRSAIGAYEEGRAEPKLTNLTAFADLFGTTVDELMFGSQSSRTSQRISGQAMRILTVATDSAGKREQVAIVPQRAAAGYLDGYGDPEYVRQLPTFSLPLKEVSQDATYRLFQIEGESMLPIPSGSYILSDFVEDWRTIGGMRPYIVVTRNEGLVFKRVENRLDTTHEDFLLISDNPDFAPFVARPDEIVEVWRARGYLAFDWPTPAFSGMERIQGTLDHIRTDIRAIKMKL